MPDEGTRAEGNDSQMLMRESVNFAIHSLKYEEYIIKKTFLRMFWLTKQVGKSGKSGIALIILALTLGVFTYLRLSDVALSADGVEKILTLMVVDLIILLLLVVVVAKKLVKVWMEHKKGLAGARLHVRLTVLFGALAVTPSILMATFSLLFFHFGLQSWFSNQVNQALNESLSVASSYLEEHKRVIERDARLMAYDLDQNKTNFVHNPSDFSSYLTMMSELRSLREVIVFNENRTILGRSLLTLALEFEMLPEWALEQANHGEVAILTNEHNDRVRALVKLAGSPASYLYVGRFVDPVVLEHLKQTEDAVKSHQSLEKSRYSIELTFILIFSLVALLLLLAAIWIGLVFAGNLVRPISKLIAAAEKLGHGNLSVRVDEGKKNDELGSLNKSFNHMARQLESQRQDLMTINRELDERMCFTESVLASVSAGVISLDKHGLIQLANKASSVLLGISFEDHYGESLVSLVPEMEPIIQQANQEKQPLLEAELSLTIQNKKSTFVVHAAREITDKKLIGFVVTFDNITDLITAQKQAAWSDVARRLAHEIKNPLTPIQLSAERIKRKYIEEIKNPEVFNECVEAIIKQVSHIGNLIDEFSAFARMPLPKMEKNNLSELCRSLFSVQQHTWKEIKFKENIQKDIHMMCDKNQIYQVLINLFKNSAEALLESHTKNPEITISLLENTEGVILTVSDNGPGFPEDKKDQLLEPYMTNRANGTGLGLSIVKKIVEDHQGTIILSNNTPHGAVVKLVFYFCDINDTIEAKE